jgi:hypothetical protein
MPQADLGLALIVLARAKARLYLRCGRCNRILDELVAGGMPPTVLSTTTFNPRFDIEADGTVTPRPSRPKITKAGVAGHWRDQAEYRCEASCGARYVTNNRDVVRAFVEAATGGRTELVVRRTGPGDQPARIESRTKKAGRASRAVSRELP